MMLDLLALLVSRPALFFVVHGHRKRYRVGANLQLEMRQAAHRQRQKSGSRTFRHKITATKSPQQKMIRM
jgi:hypothetical protein